MVFLNEMEEQRIDNMALLKVRGSVTVALLFERQRYFEFDKRDPYEKYFFKILAIRGLGIIDDFN